jgi:hypothetical protein
MNERQYQEVAEICDGILKEKPHNLARLSIAWLHIVREHPVFMRHYSGLFTGMVLKRRYHWFGFKRSLKETGRILRQLARAIVHSLTPYTMSQTLAAADIVFVSHLVHSDQYEADSDIYFDKLPAFLSRQGFKVAVLLIDHTDNPRKHHQSRVTESGVTRLVLGDTLSFVEELRLLKLLSYTSARLLTKTENKYLAARVRLAAAAEALSSSAMNTMRIAMQVASLVNQFNSKVLVTTYEGHGWERASYMAARERIPDLQCAGYQHAPLFRLQHSLQRLLYAACDPDTIFTSGLGSFKQLRNKLADVDIRNLGSARAGCQILLSEAEFSARRQSPYCLVLLEGLVNESVMLAEFSLKCAKLLPDVTFIWRTHPILPMGILIKQCQQLKMLPANIRLSHATLEEDAVKSRWVLYKGSSAVISSVLAGAAPIYLDTGEEMTLDPLFAIEHALISSADDFITLIEEGLYPSALQSELIIKHCLEIFSPLDFQVMVDYLSEKKRMV